MIEILVIGFGTFGIMVFSWFLSIKHKRYHGIYRFFSFESIFLLTLWNYRYWFENPLSWNQLLSWFLLSISLLLAVIGFIQLVKLGRPTSRNFENTSRLVTTGIFKYLRHPLYAALLYLGTGIFLKNPAEAKTIVLAAVNLVFIILTSLEEEKEMIAKFGNEYRAYMKISKMFVPFIA